ncbi:B-cell receptor CD22 [Danio aesculapii]|uniref:B-cell receptor CD22 n=1 Tax=Danio aesculapii TaxID=1142201 RepID=UPI0024BFE1B8|nr:B-cell receptor CD22 [Danio aesculapii]
MFCLFSLFSLFVSQGFCNLELGVIYTNTVICAIKGSTVHLSGTYKNLRNYKTVIFWTVNPVNITDDIKLLGNPDYKGRIQDLLNGKTHTLTLSDVKHEDEGKYCLRVMTHVEILDLQPCAGIELRVTDLRVETPEEVVEGESPVLTCKSSCNLSSTNFSWYRNGESFPESERQNQLILKSVNRGDAGSYSCAVRDPKHLPSPALTLNIRYPPKSVSVSVSGSAVIVSGDSVTLSCSSDSNPPAVDFSWFKENQSSVVGSGQSFSISSFNSSHSGRYYCEAENKYGSQRSESVSVTVEESSSSWVLITAGITASVFVMFVILMVFMLIRRKRVTPSEEQNHRGSCKTVESPEDPYMTLDPKSRCSEYDTLDIMKRSSENTESPEGQDPIYHNISK